MFQLNKGVRIETLAPLLSFFIMQEEIWKPISGYEGIYEVSSIGRIKSLERIKYGNYLQKERILTLSYRNMSRAKGGYYTILLCKNKVNKRFLVHRLVAVTFLENKEKKSQVNHKNGIKKDNKVDNLEWVTPKENIQHSFRTGLNIGNKQCLLDYTAKKKKIVVMLSFEKKLLYIFQSRRHAGKSLGIQRVDIDPGKIRRRKDTGNLFLNLNDYLCLK